MTEKEIKERLQAKKEAQIKAAKLRKEEERKLKKEAASLKKAGKKEFHINEQIERLQKKKKKI